MALDPRTPVIVGVAQSVRRPTVDELEAVPEPADTMAAVLRDAAPAAVLEAADSVRVVESVSWHYPNPALAVAERLGASPRDTVRTTTGGNSPQMLVNDTCVAIGRGELDVALVVGAEAVYTRNQARKHKVWLPWPVVPDGSTPAPRVLGVDLPGNNEMEMDQGVLLPVQVYAMFENALRAEAGESLSGHRDRVAALWARFSQVAAGNPYAWSPTARTAEEIATVGPDNRMVNFPYTKLLNANVSTDQAAALVLCSVEAAQRFGVPEDRWVFPRAGADAHDTWFVSERQSLTASPPLARVASALPMADVAHVDVYSCFPSAVQIAARALGVGLDRQLTVTGGLTFHGGPVNNYVTHSIASMVEVLRRDPGSLGLVTAVGWYLTKHAVGLYSTEPPPHGFRHVVVDEPMPSREALASYEGDVEVEAYTVAFDRAGEPERGLYALRLPDGRRAWGRSGPVDVDVELCGRKARRAADGAVTLL